MAGLDKVQADQKFEMSAVAYNQFVDAANANNARRSPGPSAGQPSGAPLGNTLVRVKNGSGGDLNLYDILGIVAIFPSRDDNLAEYTYGPITLIGQTPREPEDVGRFVVLAEPIKDGKIGLATIMGLTRARVSGASGHTNDYFNRADVTDGESGHLTFTGNGSASVLDRTDDSAVPQLTIVMLGHQYLPSATGFESTRTWRYNAPADEYQWQE